MAREGNDSIVHNYSSSYDWNPFEYGSVHQGRVFYLASIVGPIAIFVGVFSNIFAFVDVVRSRLWLKDEGYVYLAASFFANVGILLFCMSTLGLTSVSGMDRYAPANSSTFMCKVWHFLMSIFFAPGWLSVALLFNVYLRGHLTHRRRCECPMFAAKYCTLFASKIIVGVIFSVLFMLGVPYLAILEIHRYGRCHPSQNNIMALSVAFLVEAIIMWVLPFIFFLPLILLMTLCTKREGGIFGFSQIEERSVSDEQMRVMAVTLSSMTLFSQFALVFLCLSFRGVLIVNLVLALVFGISLGLQPILCFVILKALRDGFRSQLRNIRCCRRLFPSLDREEEAVQLSTIQGDPPRTTES